VFGKLILGKNKIINNKTIKLSEQVSLLVGIKSNEQPETNKLYKEVRKWWI